MDFTVLDRFRDGDFSSDDAMVLPSTLRPIVTVSGIHFDCRVLTTWVVL